jgi:hypothetical protein
MSRTRVLLGRFQQCEGNAADAASPPPEPAPVEPEADGARRSTGDLRPVETQMVTAFALDDLIGICKLPKATHAKVDVDGTEGPHLERATKTLAYGTIRELLVEIVDHNCAGTRLASVSGLLERHGYEPAKTLSHHVEDSRSFVTDHLFRGTAGPR